ncbi:unnamed protein product [Cylindrotheca closterium]|uniref:Amine oxidase domain-containing protein n=1 Tax=Cylindrotheca closterium TaxID=2856 RepID=A0AAD2JPQ6_9STRA|nr:unnamed protein product [Cylindrotheca closterium]
MSENSETMKVLMNGDTSSEVETDHDDNDWTVSDDEQVQEIRARDESKELDAIPRGNLIDQSENKVATKKSDSLDGGPSNFNPISESNVVDTLLQEKNIRQSETLSDGMSSRSTNDNGDVMPVLPRVDLEVKPEYPPLSVEKSDESNIAFQVKNQNQGKDTKPTGAGIREIADTSSYVHLETSHRSDDCVVHSFDDVNNRLSDASQDVGVQDLCDNDPQFHHSNLVDDLYQMPELAAYLDDLENVAAKQKMSDEHSLHTSSSFLEATGDVKHVQGSNDQLIHEQTGSYLTDTDKEKRDPTPRVSFAEQPSYFPGQIPRNDQKRSSSRNNHKKRKSSKGRHSNRDMAIYSGDDGDQVAEKYWQSMPKRSSRNSSKDIKNETSSSSRRSSHHRNNSRRRSNSRSRQSKHRDQRSRTKNRHAADEQEIETPQLEDVNLYDSANSSDEQFDDEYEAEARGRGRRKHRSNKHRRRKSGRQSISLPRDHADYDQSPSLNRSTSDRRSHRRSLSVSEIETRQLMQSHSTREMDSTRVQRQFRDLESPKRTSSKKRKSRRGKAESRNRSIICCGILFCLLSTVGVVLFLVMHENVSEPEPLTPVRQSPIVLRAPTTEKCRSISQGVDTISDQTESSSELKQFEIRLEVEPSGQIGESDLPFMPLLESTLQALVMPALVGCEPVTLRRYRRMMGPPLESRRRNTERLPHYLISNGLIIDAQFDLYPLASKSSRPFSYPVKVLIDIWVQEEVDSYLLANKVWKAFDEFMSSPGIPEDFPIASAVVLSVDPVRGAQEPKEGTAFPTLLPSPRPSQAPSITSSASPTKQPSSSPSISPSSFPSLSPTGLPSAKPSSVPTHIPSLQPSKFPTPRPTLNPTGSPTVAPVTFSPTRPPVPINASIDVVIIGAGAAGLSAAYHLQREGVSVVVLEATNEIGGRVKKDSTWDLDLDLGGEWLDYATSDFSNGNDMLSAILDRTVNKQTIREPNLAHYWSGSTMRYDPPGSTSTDHRWVDSTWWDFLNQELMSNLQPNTVILNSIVKTIDYGYERPLVNCEDGRTYEGSYVIVTASMKTLQDGMISFVPSLPSRYQEAIDDIEMGSGVKVFLEFTEKFFPDIFRLDPDTETYNFEDCESSRHGVRYFYNPTYGQTSTKHIMGMFAYADIADLYIGKPHDAIIQSILSLLDQIFNGKASATFVKGVVQDWSSEPYVRAAYTNFAPKNAVDRLRIPIDNRVFFAGESVFSKDSDWGFVQGAALCGEDVAEDIVDAINGR